MPALFDPQPKKEPRFLYDREKELHDLTEHLKDRRWVVILGPRRIGRPLDQRRTRPPASSNSR